MCNDPEDLTKPRRALVVRIVQSVHKIFLWRSSAFVRCLRINFILGGRVYLSAMVHTLCVPVLLRERYNATVGVAQPFDSGVIWAWPHAWYASPSLCTFQQDIFFRGDYLL